jgi:hypothetical protein
MQKIIVDRTADFPRQTLFEANVQIASARDVLRLLQHSDALCVLERRLVRSDGIVLTQILQIVFLQGRRLVVAGRRPSHRTGRARVVSGCTAI